MTVFGDLSRQFDAATKAMPIHAAYAKLTQDIKRPLFAFSRMNDHGLIMRKGELKHFAKDALLLRPKGLWYPISIQTDLADRKRLIDVRA
jgi:hypothetical protein